MTVSQTQTILHDFEGISTTLRRRTTGKGTKDRVTIEYQSQPLVANLDPVAIGKPVAEAMTKAIQEGIRAITAAASPSTILKRKYAANAFAKGEAWAKKRYAGGRTGAKPPDTQGGGRLFNDSGRLADGIFTRANRDGEWTINVPANRFDPSTFSGGVAAVNAMIQRLRELVPVLRSAQELFDTPEVRAAAREAIGMVLTKASSSASA